MMNNMDCLVSILIIIFLVVVVFYSNWPSTETFETDAVHGKEYPPQDLIYDTISIRRRNEDPNFVDGLDPDTLVKLKDTILTDKSRTSKTQTAYNDVVVYRPDRIRPFNDTHSRISEAQADNGNFIADEFDNSYYRLWLADNKREQNLAPQLAAELEQSKLNCINYKNINQCMSVCGNTENCSSFYIDKPGKCCMMTDPPYVTNRHSYSKLPNNDPEFGHRTLNALIRRAQTVDGKIVFDYIRSDDGNHTYKVDMDRTQCKALCPKCIIGRCPKNYRCTNLMADPRYNYSCMITNEDRYDETVGHTFDNPKVPYLDDNYALNEYAGYNDQNTGPVLDIPETYKIPLADRVVPSRTELQHAYKKFDATHVGPHTYYNPTTDDLFNVLNRSIPTKPSNSTNSTGRGGSPISNKNRIFGPEGFDLWVNHADLYDPDAESKRAANVAVRGFNDLTNLASYSDRKVHIAPGPSMVSKDMVEPFDGISCCSWWK